MGRSRGHRSEEEDRLTPPDQQRREVLDFDVTEVVSLLFDVQPLETGIGEMPRDFFEAGTVFTADTAPIGAQTDDQEFVRL